MEHRFPIGTASAWDAETNQWSQDHTRPADLSIFCILQPTDPDTVNPMHLEQWTFLVVSTEVLNEHCPHKKTITLSRLRKLHHQEVGFEGLDDAVRKVETRECIIFIDWHHRHKRPEYSTPIGLIVLVSGIPRLHRGLFILQPFGLRIFLLAVQLIQNLSSSLPGQPRPIPERFHVNSPASTLHRSGSASLPFPGYTGKKGRPGGIEFPEGWRLVIPLLFVSGAGPKVKPAPPLDNPAEWNHQRSDHPVPPQVLLTVRNPTPMADRNVHYDREELE